MTEPLRFGVLSHSLHRPDHSAALQLADEVALAEHADQLGFDELWWTERHSGGWQVVSDPMLLAAYAAARTQHIRLGAVMDPARRHPANLVDGAAQLDHLTRGRFLLGLSADVSSVDAAAVGLVADTEPTIAETVEAVSHLLRGKRGLSVTPRHAPWMLRDHSPQLLPRAQLDARAVSLGDSAGPELAGKFGLGLISMAAAESMGLGRENPMALTWERAEAAARGRGRKIPRSRWSLVTRMHLAETEIEARRQVRYGMARWAEYARTSLPGVVPAGSDSEALVDGLHDAGLGVVGTPAMAVAHLERVLDLSEGAGTMLVEVAGWADRADTHASLERFARQVVPHLTGSNRARLAAAVTEVSEAAAVRPVGRRAAGRPAVPAPMATPVRGISRIHADEAAARRRGRHAVDPPAD